MVDRAELVKSKQAVQAEVRVDSIGPLSWWRTGRSIRKDAPDVLVFKYWISFFPGVALLVLIVCINLVADHLRDVLNPRLQTH